jgi:hypothetical protein
MLRWQLPLHLLHAEHEEQQLNAVLTVWTKWKVALLEAIHLASAAGGRFMEQMRLLGGWWPVYNYGSHIQPYPVVSSRIQQCVAMWDKCNIYTSCKICPCHMHEVCCLCSSVGAVHQLVSGRAIAAITTQQRCGGAGSLC